MYILIYNCFQIVVLCVIQVLKLKPFMEVPLYYGNKGDNSYRRVGKWKGLLRLLDNKSDSKQDENAALEAAEAEKARQDRFEEIKETKHLFVRVYIISGSGFAAHDNNGKSDPYLKVSIGNLIYVYIYIYIYIF